jgi:hypothetical protein
MRIFFAMINDVENPIGGVKQAHRMIDVLCEEGYDAAVIMPRKDFRCSWFENDTPVVYREDVHLKEDDWLILSEDIPGMPVIDGIDKCHIVVYAQNPFTITRSFGGPSRFAGFYRENVEAIMCVSWHSVDAIQHLMPHTNPLRIRHSFDRETLGLGVNKRKLITYMPRRLRKEVEDALAVLHAEGVLKGWRIKALQGMRSEDVVEELKKSTVFISGSSYEGFGMPPAEAMACGCVVVGFDGSAGEEFMRPDITFLVPENDNPCLVGRLREVVSKPLDELQEIGRKASEYILKEYSTKRERESIVQAWDSILVPVPGVHM